MVVRGPCVVAAPPLCSSDDVEDSSSVGVRGELRSAMRRDSVCLTRARALRFVAPPSARLPHCTPSLFSVSLRSSSLTDVVRFLRRHCWRASVRQGHTAAQGSGDRHHSAVRLTGRGAAGSLPVLSPALGLTRRSLALCLLPPVPLCDRVSAIPSTV